nr:odorant-binding protein 20 [Peridroma saucia]
MSKFTCLVLFAIAVNFNGVHGFGAVQAIFSGCAKEYGLTEDSLQVIMSAKDVAKLDPCFWACMLKKAEFINDKGEYDPEAGMAYLEKIMPLNKENEMIKEIATNCKSVNDETVSDGEAGCERGALVAVCVMEQVETRKKQMAP